MNAISLGVAAPIISSQNCWMVRLPTRPEHEPVRSHAQWRGLETANLHAEWTCRACRPSAHPTFWPAHDSMRAGLSRAEESPEKAWEFQSLATTNRIFASISERDLRYMLNVTHLAPHGLSVLEENLVGQHLSYQVASHPAFSLMRRTSDSLV